MTEEDITLLLKDLSARLPYGVKIALKNNGAYHHDNVAKKGDITIDILEGFNGSYFNIYHSNPLDWDWYDDDIDIEDIKPYLFPLSSMTEEQWKEYQTLKMTDWVEGDINGVFINSGTITDWLNKNHFDYRGLIEKGLAIDATNKNIY
jgi:hypothetical protein